MNATDIAELNGRIAAESAKEKRALSRAKVQMPDDATITNRILHDRGLSEVDIRPLLDRWGKSRRTKRAPIGCLAEQQ